MSRFKVALVGLRRDYSNPLVVERLQRAVDALVQMLMGLPQVAGVVYSASENGQANFALALPGWEDTLETTKEIAAMNALGVPVFSDLSSLILAMAGFRPSQANVARVQAAFGSHELRSFSRDFGDPLLAELFKK